MPSDSKTETIVIWHQLRVRVSRLQRYALRTKDSSDPTVNNGAAPPKNVPIAEPFYRYLMEIAADDPAGPLFPNANALRSLKNFLNESTKGKSKLIGPKSWLGFPECLATMSMASTSKVKMIFSNYWRYSWEFALNPKDGEEKLRRFVPVLERVLGII